MEEELTKQCERLSLTKQEKKGVELQPLAKERVEKQNHFYQLVMIVANKTLNKEAFKNTMTKVWRCESQLQFLEVGLNKFLIEFYKEKNMVRVVNGKPWTFDRWLLCLQAFDGSMSINEVSFNKEEFWIQAYNLPFDCMNQEFGHQIGSNIGRVLKVHADDRGIEWERFLRIRVEVDIIKALIRGLFLTLNGKKTWVSSKYERLSSLCFKCGVLKHSQLPCPSSQSGGEGGGGQSQYVTWLRVPTARKSELQFKRYEEWETQCAQPGAQPWREGKQDRDDCINGKADSK